MDVVMDVCMYASTQHLASEIRPRPPLSDSLISEVENLAVILKEAVVVGIGRTASAASPSGGDDDLVVVHPDVMQNSLHGRSWEGARLA